MAAIPPRALAALLLLLSLVAFLATDRRFALLEDETMIVEAARAPVVVTLGSFWRGGGWLHHPPLSDVLLHFWLPVGGFAPWALRLPSVVFFLAGLLILAQAARRIAGEPAFIAAICLGVLSPFAFHFARLTGWYSFTFFLVAAATLAHLGWIANASPRRFAVLVAIDLALIWSNYYGWAIVACLALEVCLSRPRREAAKFLPAVFGILSIAYLPLWLRAGRLAAGTLMPFTASGIVRMVLSGAYHFYTLFVSESVAPWFPQFSLPAALAIAAALIAMWRLLGWQGRRFFLYFGFLFAIMVIGDFVTTKRLLFISAWLFFAFAVALANIRRHVLRSVLALSLAFAAAIGWMGIVAQKYYAVPHFIEPWPALADDAARALARGETVVTNSPSFSFYLNWSLERMGLIPKTRGPAWAEFPNLFTTDRWTQRASGPVLLVTGVNIDVEDETARAASWLGSHCRAISARNLVPDSGYALKARFFPGAGQRPFRISWREFNCGQPAAGS